MNKSPVHYCYLLQDEAVILSQVPFLKKVPAKLRGEERKSGFFCASWQPLCIVSGDENLSKCFPVSSAPICMESVLQLSKRRYINGHR